MPVFEMSDANFPVDAEGRTYHVECRRGDIANRVVTVGDPQRAKLMAKKFDKILLERSSHRGFLIITGIYKDVPITVVSIGMGLSMMDFFVRETRAVVDGPMSIVRFGSCGSICDAKPGNIIVCTSSYGIMRNYDHFTNPFKKAESPYLITDRVQADPTLTLSLSTKLKNSMGKDSVFEGSNGCADSFYGSQGRLGSNFVDENDNLIPTLKKKYSDAVSLEMEAHMLYHLAAVSKDAQSGEQSIKATCALIVFADRTGNEFITPEASQIAVEHCTEAIFNTLVEESFKGSSLHPVEGSVWEGSVPDAPIVPKQETPVETRDEEPAPEVTKETSPEAVKEASPKATKEASPEAVKEASPEAAKKDTPEATEDAEEEV
ncbi:Purine nucleoside phosphorylase DeoD-type [Smittium culicis]|uniref:Purine nucleoside phosphorylase DeoD-type n=1 Tax=Smittium culicis TaxID=133412 RepID=A0A1R1X0H2_9FUNG|nr:Purine nucleoside phosphorylase DeoD-type [Smittium culicis]